MKPFLYVIALGVMPQVVHAETRLENMKMTGFLSAISKYEVAPVQGSPVSYLASVKDVNGLNYIYGHPYDRDFGGVSSALGDGAYDVYGKTSTSARVSAQKWNSDGFVREWSIPKLGSTKFVEISTTGRFKAEDLMIEGAEHLGSDFVVPSTAIKQWDVSSDFYVEGSAEYAVIFNAKAEYFDEKTLSWGGFEQAERTKTMGVWQNKTYKTLTLEGLEHCHTRIMLDGETVDTTSTDVHSDGKIRMIKVLSDLKPGKHALTASIVCPNLHKHRISFTAFGVVDTNTRTPIPVSPWENRAQKTPRLSGNGSIKHLERLGFDHWSQWKDEPLSLTNISLILENDQDVGLSNTTHNRQLLVADRFFPKEEGIYQILIETKSNVCLATVLTKGKMACAGVLHPSYYASFSDDTVELAGGAFHSAKPHRYDITAFEVELADIQAGMPFIYSIRGRLPWRDRQATRNIFIADIHGEYSASFDVDGHLFPAAVQVSNSLTDARAFQEVSLWIKAPSDSRFRPLSDYDFKE